MASLFQTIASVFTGSRNGLSPRRDQTFSTRDAFSLPSSSSELPHAYGRAAVRAADVDGEPSTYTYPPLPANGGTYDSVPQSSFDLRQGLSPTSGNFSFGARQPPVLPTHRNSALPPPSYPRPSHSWARIRSWLSNEYPELDDTLNYGILPPTLLEIEAQLGMQLPPPVRESYLAVDGQEVESAAGCPEGLFYGLTFLSLEDALEEWRFWRDVDEDPATGANERLKQIMDSIPADWVRKEYSQRGWIPLVTDKAGNYMGVDLNPGEAGTPGQVIIFGRDFDTKVVMFRGDEGGWAKWLATFAEELESGEGFELGATGDASDGSEDGVGYESYFYGGVGPKAEGGGVGEASGLRLTGEYRGWSVLEALADRSVKRWRELGVLAPSNPAHPDVVAPTPIAGSSSQPIPLVIEPTPNDSTEKPPGTKNDTARVSGHRVAKSLSKFPPPAPLPLPTAEDVATSAYSTPDGSPPYLRRKSLDEEAGIGLPMRQRRPAPVHAKESSTMEAELIATPGSRPLPPDSPLILTDEPTSLDATGSPTTPTSHSTTSSGPLMSDGVEPDRVESARTSADRLVDGDLSSEQLGHPAMPPRTHVRHDSKDTVVQQMFGGLSA